MEKLGIWWFSTFDTTGYVFKLLKANHKVIRYAFYISFIIAFYIFMSWSAVLLRHHFEGQEVFLILGRIIYALSITLTFGIFGYEAIMKYDFEILRDRVLQYKQEKQEWWRLKNMSGFWRSIVYIISAMAGLQVVLFFISYFLVANAHDIVKNIHTIADRAAFISSIQHEVLVYTGIYTLFFLSIVFLLERSIKRRKHA